MEEKQQRYEVLFINHGQPDQVMVVLDTETKEMYKTKKMKLYTDESSK